MRTRLTERSAFHGRQLRRARGAHSVTPTRRRETDGIATPSHERGPFEYARSSHRAATSSPDHPSGRAARWVVGESYYQPALCSLAKWAPGGDKVSHNIVAMLVPEPDNPYDENAIAVRIEGRKVGHLSGEDAVRYGPGVRRLMAEQGDHVALTGVIAGGGYLDGEPRLLGVFLNQHPADFGL